MATETEATVITIRRTISTAPYESVTVELTETYGALSAKEKPSVYKEQSELVEKMVNFEAKKYAPKGEEDGRGRKRR